MNTSRIAARLAAVAAATGSGGLLIAGHAAAFDMTPLCIYSSAEEKAADLADDGLENCSLLDDGPTLANPNLILPYLPEGDDGPDVTLNPNVSVHLPELFGDDDEPDVTLDPDATIPLPELPEGPSDQPVDQPVDPPAEQQASDAPQSPSTSEPTGPAPADVIPSIVPFVRITSAAVECDGSVIVGYETDADPALGAAADHVVTFSPTAVPSLAFSQRVVGQPLTGPFTLDVPTPSAQEYLVFVVADFQPSNPDGVVLVDEAIAAAPADCPTS